jgi:hypothetical protein
VQTVEERVALGQYATALLFLYEDQYFRYSNGFLTEERWQAARPTPKAAWASGLPDPGGLPEEICELRNIVATVFSSRASIGVQGTIKGDILK